MSDVKMNGSEFPICPNCNEARLEEHKRRKDLLICPVCWTKYDKEKAFQGIWIQVKSNKKQLGLRHKRGYKETTTTHVINWSGGHDSTLMTHYLLNYGSLKNVKNVKVVFVDSTITVPETLEYIDRIVEEFDLAEKFVCLKPKTTFFQELLKYHFWPSIRALWCRKVLKLNPIKDYYYTLGKVVEYLGISKADSGVRRNKYLLGKTTRKFGRKTVKTVYPILDWTDEDKRHYFAENNIPLNPAYDKLGLSGCWYCPYYHEKDFRRLREHYPDLFAKLVKCEEMTQKRALPDFSLKDLD